MPRKALIRSSLTTLAALAATPALGQYSPPGNTTPTKGAQTASPGDARPLE
jgi:hypothetical protein